jgi:predicted dehydrogenase
MKRRNFIHSSATAGAGLLILPGYMQSIKGANDRLNIALIGAHGRASQLYSHINSENIVAICDVNAKNMSLAAAEFPKAKQYTDWRKCIEQKDIDAVFICTPDHHHAFINIWAMNRGLHVFCEKPLADSVEEARAVRKTYLANRTKLATQHGTQRHAHENFARVSELVRNGAIGELKVVQAWGSRTHNEKGYRPSEGPPPTTIDWDQWIGPVRMHPYNSGYFSATSPGSNCLRWNMFLDFGAWQIGDMGAHTMDLAWQAIDADLPLTAEATGDPWNPEVAPSDHHAIFTFPANSWRGEITLEWFQGTLKPEIPHSAIDITKIGHGVMFRGTKGTLIADFTSRILIPDREGADMTYYNAPDKNQVTPAFGNFWAQWINACKGDPTKTTCNFDYAGRMIETLYLGLAAHQSGKKLNYESSEGRVTNDPAANDFLRKEYRSGWVLNG